MDLEIRTLMDSEVKMFLIIGRVFLCVGCVMDGMYVSDRLDTVLEIDGTGRRPSVTKLFMDEIVEMPVRIRRARKLESYHRSRWCSIRFPQFQCVERKMPVMQMCGKMTRGALTGPTHCKGTSTLRL